MKNFKKILSALLLLILCDLYFTPLSVPIFIYINLFPNLSFHKTSTVRNKILEDGAFLLALFLLTVIAVPLYTLIAASTGFITLPDNGSGWAALLPKLILWIVSEAILFWNGILRVYITSVQLGIKWRIIGIICGWIPLVHIWALCKIIRITRAEVQYEDDKYILNETRAENQECRTKYPLLLVHGVFFRDFRFFHYWGRIPVQLKKNGSVIYYGCQQSAASVAECGQELSERIRAIVQQTGCGKVNIIAHSKGGLDSRYAITACSAAPYVASLTTINTPHRGCIFADYLLDKIPERVQQRVARTYNAALSKCGDRNPDFLEAVRDLTASSCARMNEKLPDHPAVYYQSVGSIMNYAVSGRFPLNMSYPLVKHFDGANDGLVSLDSTKWGSHFISLSVPKGRGISHGDMIDLNRENIPGFDVREFYTQLVKNLKQMGF